MVILDTAPATLDSIYSLMNDMNTVLLAIALMLAVMLIFSIVRGLFNE